MLTAREYMKQIEEGRDPFKPSLHDTTEKCAKCQVMLQEAITGYRKFNNTSYCSDDYFEELGAMVEDRPVGLPRSSLGH